MSPEAVITFHFLIVLLFGVITFLITARYLNIGISLLSPIFIFSAAYILAFLVRPALFYIGGFTEVRYDWMTFSESSFIQSQVFALLGYLAFCFGFLQIPFFKRPFKIYSWKEIDVSDNSTHLRSMQSVSNWMAFAGACIYLYFLYQAGALSLNFLKNRMAMFDALFGAGYINMVNLITSLFVSFSAAIYVRLGKIGSIGGLALLLHFVGNLFVSNRNQVTIILFLILFAFYVRRWVCGRPLNLVAMFSVLFGILFAGVWIGLSRNEDPEASALLLLMFLTATFDMGDMFAEVVHNISEFYWGIPWLESLFYTYIPRVIFPAKPIIYGSTRFQADFLVDSTNEDGVFLATYPIGAFGEAFANFGIIGVIVTLFLLGFILRKSFIGILDLVSHSKVSFSSLLWFLLYVNLCANSLGYMRSIGGFLSAAVFIAISFAGIYFFLNNSAKLVSSFHNQLRRIGRFKL